MSETTPDQMIAALRDLQDHIAGVARGLDAEQLVVTSGATEWPVAQVLSHLGSGAEINVGTVQAALDGTEGAALASNEDIWARWDAMAPEEQRTGFLDWGDRLVAMYEAMDAEQRRDIRFDISFLPEPADVVVAGGMRLNELTLHGWDVDVAFDQHATLPDGGLHLILASLAPLARFVGRPEQLGRNVLLRVELTHPSEVVSLRISDAGVEIGSDVPAVGDTDALLHAPTEAFVRLLAGRLAPEHTPKAVHVEGDLDLDQLREVFPGY
jgi:uncharacterized protein (TIGR03083 family)